MRNPNPPRNPPTGFFGVETVPRLGAEGASLRRRGEVARCRVGVVVVVVRARWTRVRDSERQRIVEAIVVKEKGAVYGSALAGSRVLLNIKVQFLALVRAFSSRTMAPKRKNDDAGELSARERKKLRMADARTISVQETPTAGGPGPATNQTNAVASSSNGPSKTTVQFNCTFYQVPCRRRATLML